MRRAGCLCAAMLAPLLAWALPGCAGYALSGRVIEGDISYVEVVSADDPRLSTPGVAGAQLRVTIDPRDLSRKLAAQGVSSSDGSFSLPVDAVGAGVLEYDVGIEARRKGFQRAESFMRLPPSGRRLLVVLAPGQDTDRFDEPAFDSLYDEYEHYRDGGR